MVEILRISLFGKFEVAWNDRTLATADAHKTQELFCYLLMYRDRPHRREVLAGQLWGNSSTVQSKKYLRQSLWQLQCALEPYEQACAGKPVLLVQNEWIQVNPAVDIWLDVAAFEQACAEIRKLPERDLDSAQAQILRTAVDLYRDDLLIGWYQDWCLCERERLQNMLLGILDQLTRFCQTHHDYAAGLDYGERVLRIDPAHERTHRHLMLMRYLQGDRTGALRQYQRCEAALAQELNIKPSKHTRKIFEHINADCAEPAAHPPTTPAAPGADGVERPHLPDVLERLQQLQAVLNEALEEVQRDIQVVERIAKRDG